MLETILSKHPCTWTDEEWDLVRSALKNGDIRVGVKDPKLSPQLDESLRKFIEETMQRKQNDDQSKRWIPVPANPFDSYEIHEPCAVREYFKRYPNETSVMMVCYCRNCTVYCTS